MKKAFVLIILFIFPIVAYVFFASGIHNFGRLPILTEKVSDIRFSTTDVTLENKISILGFLGSEVEYKKGNAFNLNQKIYKPFFEFKEFQIVMIVPEGNEAKIEDLKKDLGALVDIKNWKFVFGSAEEITTFFNALQTDISLDSTLATPYVFIIDKDRALRGRTNDEDEGTKFGFNTNSVAELNNKMEDDVKIILAEYRSALKKNNAYRSK